MSTIAIRADHVASKSSFCKRYHWKKVYQESRYFSNIIFPELISLSTTNTFRIGFHCHFINHENPNYRWQWPGEELQIKLSIKVRSSFIPVPSRELLGSSPPWRGRCIIIAMAVTRASNDGSQKVHNRLKTFNTVAALRIYANLNQAARPL